LNGHYQTGLPADLAALLDAKAEPEGWSWQGVYKFALWLGLVAVDDKGGLRNSAIALGYGPGEWPEGAGGDRRSWRPIKVPREARDLVDIAKREGVEWQPVQRVALIVGLKTIEARGGLNETKRQVEALRRSVVTGAVATAQARTA
jgi:hypothetical protein